MTNSPPEVAGEAPTAFSKSTWVALTDDDRDRAFQTLPDMLDGFMKKWGWLHFAKAIEDICREKNASTAAKADAGEVLHRMKYHHRPAEDGFPADFDLYEMDVDCKECFEVLIVRAASPKTNGGMGS